MVDLLNNYLTYKEGSLESKKTYESLVKWYNQAGYTPKIRSLCYCMRKVNIPLIKKVCNG